MFCLFNFRALSPAKNKTLHKVILIKSIINANCFINIHEENLWESVPHVLEWPDDLEQLLRFAALTFKCHSPSVFVLSIILPSIHLPLRQSIHSNTPGILRFPRHPCTQSWCYYRCIRFVPGWNLLFFFKKIYIFQPSSLQQFSTTGWCFWGWNSIGDDDEYFYCYSLI